MFGLGFPFRHISNMLRLPSDLLSSPNDGLVSGPGPSSAGVEKSSARVEGLAPAEPQPGYRFKVLHMLRIC